MDTNIKRYDSLWYVMTDEYAKSFNIVSKTNLKFLQFLLLRLCFKPDITVIGGSKKMFSHFLNEYNPNSIISYCDVSKFSRTIYEKLGFKLERTNSPAKHWYLENVEFPNHITASYLLQRGFDQIFKTGYGKGTDNELLMLSYGYLPVYDCRQKVFIYES